MEIHLTTTVGQNPRQQCARLPTFRGPQLPEGGSDQCVNDKTRTLGFDVRPIRIFGHWTLPCIDVPRMFGGFDFQKQFADLPILLDTGWMIRYSSVFMENPTKRERIHGRRTHQ